MPVQIIWRAVFNMFVEKHLIRNIAMYLVYKKYSTELGV